MALLHLQVTSKEIFLCQNIWHCTLVMTHSNNQSKHIFTGLELIIRSIHISCMLSVTFLSFFLTISCHFGRAAKRNLPNKSRSKRPSGRLVAYMIAAPHTNIITILLQNNDICQHNVGFFTVYLTTTFDFYGRGQWCHF